MRLRLLGDDAPAEPPAMPDAPAFRSLRGVERDCRFFTTGVVSNNSSGFVDLTSERREDEDAFFDLRIGVAFDDLDEADPSLNCTLRYRGAVRDVSAPVLGPEDTAVRAPVIRVARAAPAFSGARALGVVFEAEAIHNTQCFTYYLSTSSPSSATAAAAPR